VDSVRAQGLPTPAQVIVVLNGPRFHDEIENGRDITLVRDPRPGAARARNTGVQAATGVILAFLDSDCVASPNWLPSALATIRDHGGAAIVAGAITRSGSDANPASRYDRHTYLRQRAYVVGGGNFVTANIVLTRATASRIGPFDERLTEAAFEDWDWAQRARDLGIPVAYDPGAIVDHPCITSLRGIASKSARLARGELRWLEIRGEQPGRRGLLSALRSDVRRVMGLRDARARERISLIAPAAVATWSSGRARR
jgi:GT2 family glycosyltransferase